MSSIPHVLFASGLTACTLAAQIHIEARTADTMTARTTAGSQTIAPGSALASGQGVNSTYRSSIGNCTASAMAQVLFSGTSAGATAAFTNSARSDEQFFCSGGPANAGQHAVIVALSSPIPVAGYIRVTATPSRQASAFSYAAASYGVDVGVDGSFELRGGTNPLQPTTSPDFVELPVVLGSTPLHIRLEAAAEVAQPFGPVSASMRLDLAFVAGAGRWTEFGSPCGAHLESRLWKQGNSAGLSFGLTSTTPTPHAFLVAGTQDLAVPVPPTGCVLRTDLLVFVPVDLANGPREFALPLTVQLPVLDVRFQLLSGVPQAGGTAWHTSQAHWLQLP
ncbi:MAG: hypothetical protein R3F56_03940 [Planctomycetota bacterium]